MLCELCGLVEAKYCCPGCEKRTCSLACVREHKIRFSCEGLKAFPRAPPASSTNEKYSESLFMQDYNFLENVCSFTTELEHRRQTKLKEDKTKDKEDARDKIEEEVEEEEKNDINIKNSRSERANLFKKIQKTAKLAELRLLPEAFSRSKKNRSHFIKNAQKSEQESWSEAPEVESSRSGRIAWTLDVVEYESGRLIGTLDEISDDSKLVSFLPENAGKAFLRNETRQQGIEKWKEISDWRGKCLSTVLIGGRCFEYPVIGITETGRGSDCCEGEIKEVEFVEIAPELEEGECEM